ncbi:MAG: hypothetical protein R2754_01245 [Microthrixaceae bacterium]
MKRRSGLAVMGVLLAVVVLVVLAGQGSSGAPLDPDTTGGEGLSIAVALARQLDTEVDVIESDDPLVSYDAVFIPTAGSADGPTSRRWAEAADAGASVVLGEPSDRIGAESVFSEGLDPSAVPSSGCTVPELRGLDDPTTPVGTFVDGVRPGPGDRFCFGSERGAQVVVTPTGAGQVVTLAGPWLYQNSTLSERREATEEPTPDNLYDNGAVLASVARFGPGRRVAVVRPFWPPGADGDGPPDLISLVGATGRGIWIQLGLAALILGVAIGRRVGRPVHEPLPVSVAGSEHTEAVGNLLRRRRDPAGTAQLLRSQVLAVARRSLGMDAHAPDAAVATAVADRLNRNPDEVSGLLVSNPVRNENALVTLAQDLEDLRGELIHGHTVS